MIFGAHRAIQLQAEGIAPDACVARLGNENDGTENLLVHFVDAFAAANVPCQRIGCLNSDAMLRVRVGEREVLAESTPLGRVLIDHGVLMKVRLIGLWRIEPGPDMCRALELDRPTVVYGRTAMIDFHQDPAIELLEISAPVGGTG